MLVTSRAAGGNVQKGDNRKTRITKECKNMEALIKVLDRDGGVKAAAKGEDQVVLAWKGQYEEGDRIVLQLSLIHI